MNIFDLYLQKIKKLVQENKEVLGISIFNEFKNVTVEIPPNHLNFDLSCNIALILSKLNKQNPIELGQKIKELMKNKLTEISNTEIAGPGFINFNLDKTTTFEIIQKIISSGNKFGSFIDKKICNIEFVSANPTGPMHVGHCRGAIYGDVLSNLLEFNGNKVVREYYINDYGNQIKNFTRSIFLRIREIKYNEKFVISEDLYPGEYIIQIAKGIIKKDKDKFDNFEKSFEKLKTLSVSYSMEMIKSDLSKLGIKHNNFVSESELVNKNLVTKAINELKKNNFVEEGYLDPPKGEDTKNWKKTKRLIFKSELFGDDTNRALQKNDGSWTYFANDVAYHFDKIKRKYDKLINILGADHTGYIKRVSGAVKALSNDKIKLNCKVCQLVKLFKDGKPYKMSKRSGEFISVGDLLKEVNKDSIRFMMLNRSNDVELDFNFNKILEKNKDNPVFYVQYCNARINSLFGSIDKNILKDKTEFKKNDFNLNQYEKEILRKIFEWPKIVKISALNYEPHRIPFYLYKLSTLFHSYWSKGNSDSNYKFVVNGKIKNSNIILIVKLLKIVLTNGMNILGVSLPKKM